MVEIPRSVRPAEGGASATFPYGPWLLSERADFWVASAGGGAFLIVIAVVLLWRGDRELSAADVLLGELHLGATYEAIVRRRLWRRMPLDVVAIPLGIVAVTCILLLTDGALIVTTAILYLGAWHRGRQSLGIARHYQQRAGGPVSSLHCWLLPTSFYLPMMAAVAYYTSTAETHEGAAFQAGDRAHVLGDVHGLRVRRARALADRRPGRPLLAGRSHLDCASPPAGTLGSAPLSSWSGGFADVTPSFGKAITPC